MNAPLQSAPAIMALPYHTDELIAHRKAGIGTFPAAIRDGMPEQHRDFFGGLRYLLAASIGADGWPAATMLSGAPGFIESPDPRTLQIAWPSEQRDTDPASLAGAFAEGREVALLGIDLATRRRNRANGRAIARKKGDAPGLTIAVEQSFGNCPKYITRRAVQSIARQPGPTQQLTGLDAAARAAIAHADTFFVASHSRAGSAGQGGADISHRGGPSGFIRIDGDDLWIPEFPGNNYLNTLGNLLGEPRAALLFIDFGTGDLLHLQGEVEIGWDGTMFAAVSSSPQQAPQALRYWRFHTLRGWRRQAALPLRWTIIDDAPA